MNDHQTAIVIVDHGSRRAESNQMLLSIVQAFRDRSSYEIVEPAHMELAEPSIETAFKRCVQRGAQLIVIHPYFLLPGRHWHQDIPDLCAAAAANHKDVTLKYLITAPLALHPLMTQVIQDRIEHCLAQAQGSADPCDACANEVPCQVKG